MNKLTGKKSAGKTTSSNAAKRKYFNPYTTNTTTRQSELNNSGSRNTRSGARTNRSSGGSSYKNKDISSREKTDRVKRPKTSPNKSVASKRTKQNKPLTRNQKRRQRRIRQIIAIVQLLIVMLGTAFAVWGLFNMGDRAQKTKVSYQTVRLGTIDDSSKLEGVILRNEQVVYGDNTEDIRYVVAEGDKVKKDGMVYVIVDEANLQTSMNEQSQIDKQIYDKAEQRKDISYYQDDISNLNQLLANDFSIFYDNRHQDTTNFVYTLRGKLEKSIGERTYLYTEEQADISGAIVAKKEEIIEDINKYQVGRTAPEAGIISYQIDGKETVDASSVLDKLDYKYYEQLGDKSKVDDKEQGTPIYKIILDNKWYIVSYIDKDSEKSFKEGETYNLYFEHNTKEVPFKLKSLTTENEDKIKLVFEATDQIGKFLDVRTTKFSIGERAVSGIKIPKETIVEQNMIKIPLSYSEKKDSKYGVYRQKGDVAEYVEIDVEYKKEDYLYVRQDVGDLNKVQINDVLIEPTNTANSEKYTLNEIETLQGVYAVNGGITEFKTISVILLSSEYAIVDEEGLTKLKVGDRIISNPKSIGIDQLIKNMDVQNK